MNDASQMGSGNPTQTVGLPKLSVVIPTFNERDNVVTLFRRLEKTLADCFKYRNKLGLDTVLEALRLYRSRKRPNVGRAHEIRAHLPLGKSGASLPGSPAVLSRDKAPKRLFLGFPHEPSYGRRFFIVDDSAQLWHIYVNAKRSVCNTK